MFQFTDQTTVTLAHINMRTEKHGTVDVDSYDFDFVLTVGNYIGLPLIAPGLYEHVYYRADATEDQAEIDGVDQVRPDLRFPKLANFAWTDEADNVDLVFVYGLGDDISNIKFEAGKSVLKKVECEQGGTTHVYFQYKTSSMPDGALDKLRKKLKQEVTITMVRPEKLIQQAVIDGSVGHPALAGMEPDNPDRPPVDNSKAAPRSKRAKEATAEFLRLQAEQQEQTSEQPT